MVITSIEKNKKNKDRLLVYVDNQYSFFISEEDYIGMGLYEKKELTKEEIEFVKRNVNFKYAKLTAVKFLSFKLRCEKEVRIKLEKEGYDDETIRDVIEELKSMGYINDKIYAQKYLYDRYKLKPQSKRLLKSNLKNKGISEEIIDEVLSDWKIDEAVLAETMAKKKFGKYDLRDEKILKKVYSFLHHRGFDYEIIDRAVENLTN